MQQLPPATPLPPPPPLPPGGQAALTTASSLPAPSAPPPLGKQYPYLVPLVDRLATLLQSFQRPDIVADLLGGWVSGGLGGCKIGLRGQDFLPSRCRSVLTGGCLLPVYGLLPVQLLYALCLSSLLLQITVSIRSLSPCSRSISYYANDPSDVPLMQLLRALPGLPTQEPLLQYTACQVGGTLGNAAPRLQYKLS